MKGTITYYYYGLKFLPKMHRGNNFIQFNFKPFWYISAQHRESLLKFSFKYRKKNENMVVKSVKNSFIVAMAILTTRDISLRIMIWQITAVYGLLADRILWTLYLTLLSFETPCQFSISINVIKYLLVNILLMCWITGEFILWQFNQACKP